MDFEQLISKFEDLGYQVEHVNEDSVVVYNDGAERDYSLFDNTVATLAVNNDFGFVCQANMKEMHKETVVNKKPSENYEIYMGVFKGGDISVLEESSRSFDWPDNPNF